KSADTRPDGEEPPRQRLRGEVLVGAAVAERGDEQGAEIGAAEGDAGDAASAGHVDAPDAAAVRCVAADGAVADLREPEASLCIDRAAIGTVGRLAEVEEDAPVGDAAGRDVVVPGEH